MISASEGFSKDMSDHLEKIGGKTGVLVYTAGYCNIYQVPEMLRATAEQQLAFTNLQPTNLILN